MSNNSEHNKILNSFFQTKDEGYKDFFYNSIELSNLIYQNSKIEVDLVYATMHLVAQKLLLQINSLQSKDSYYHLLDVGSMFSFISFASCFFDVTFIEALAKDIKFYDPGLCKITGMCGEAQKLPFQNNQFEVVTSLHAIEHFGLGRYGDTLDYFGDQKGIKEFSRVLKPGGFLLTGVPTSSISKLQFNGQRIYSPKDFDEIVLSSGFKKINGMISYYPGVFKNGMLVGSIDTINSYPEQWTPPVYVALYKKISD